MLRGFFSLLPNLFSLECVLYNNTKHVYLMKKLYILTLLIISVTALFAQPKLIRVLHQNNLTGSGWQDTVDYNFKYNSKGLLETYDNNNLAVSPKQPVFLDSNYYNLSGQLDSSKGFHWDGNTNSWSSNITLRKYI